MDLFNDLSCELAWAVLVEKKHIEKLESKDILPLLGQIEKALQQISGQENQDNKILPAEQTANFVARQTI